MEEKSELELKFEKEYELFSNKIKYHLDKAKEHLDLAIEVSEEYGIPITNAYISNLNNNFVPSSFYTKWENLDREFLSEFDLYLNEYGEGWEHSSVC